MLQALSVREEAAQRQPTSWWPTDGAPVGCGWPSVGPDPTAEHLSCEPELVLEAVSPAAPGPGEAPRGLLSWDVLKPDPSPAMDVA